MLLDREQPQRRCGSTLERCGGGRSKHLAPWWVAQGTWAWPLMSSARGLERSPGKNELHLVRGEVLSGDTSVRHAVQNQLENPAQGFKVQGVIRRAWEA